MIKKIIKKVKIELIFVGLVILFIAVFKIKSKILITHSLMYFCVLAMICCPLVLLVFYKEKKTKGMKIMILGIIIISIGAWANALVVSTNGFRMPIYDEDVQGHKNYQETHFLYSDDETINFSFLADRISTHSASLGDVVMLIGLPVLFIGGYLEVKREELESSKKQKGGQNG